MMPANLIQLRQMLSERFPGAHMGLQKPSDDDNFSPTELSQIDDLLRGGLPKGALTEIVNPKPFSGSATLLREMVSNAARKNQIIALVDGTDSLDVAQIEDRILSRLLWIRCSAADKSLQAVDLILRDNNLPLVLLDLKSNPENQLRKIPTTSWFRFQRLVEETSTVCVVFTPRPMVSPAQVRITCKSKFSLDALENDSVEILRELKLDVFDRRQFKETDNNLLQSSA